MPLGFRSFRAAVTTLARAALSAIENRSSVLGDSSDTSHTHVETRVASIDFGIVRIGAIDGSGTEALS